MTLADDAVARAQPDPGPCPCGVSGVAPWRGHDLPWSPASAVAGLLTLAFALAAMWAGKQPWIGPVLVAIYVVATAVAWAALGRQGHRGGCRLRRAAWMGLAAFGVPLRMITGLAI